MVVALLAIVLLVLGCVGPLLFLARAELRLRRLGEPEKPGPMLRAGVEAGAALSFAERVESLVDLRHLVERTASEAGLVARYAVRCGAAWSVLVLWVGRFVFAQHWLLAGALALICTAFSVAFGRRVGGGASARHKVWQRFIVRELASLSDRDTPESSNVRSARCVPSLHRRSRGPR